LGFRTKNVQLQIITVFDFKHPIQGRGAVLWDWLLEMDSAENFTGPTKALKLFDVVGETAKKNFLKNTLKRCGEYRGLLVYKFLFNKTKLKEKTSNEN